MRNARAKTRSGLYVHPGGVALHASGLEIKDRETVKEKDEKKQMKGAFVPGAGFFTSWEAAFNKARTFLTLQDYQARRFARMGF